MTTTPAEKATAGPWELIEEPTGNDNFCRSIYGPAGDYKGLLIGRVDQNFSRPDGDLILAAVNACFALSPSDPLRAAEAIGEAFAIVRDCADWRACLTGERARALLSRLQGGDK